MIKNNIEILSGPYESNTFIWDTGAGAIIVDCGAPYDSIVSYLKKRAIQPIALLLTHGHFDHIISAADLQALGVPIYIHQSDAERLYTDKSEGPRAGFVVQHCRPDHTLLDGQVLSICGIDIQVLHTPGHTEGSVCFVVHSHSMVFTGDTLFYHDQGRTDLYGGDENKMQASLRKLLALDDMVAYTGHGRHTSLAQEAEYFGL
jgi:glyoxylase-like metal-dependent hydrolase (beta-lactamase superfamily II)